MASRIQAWSLAIVVGALSAPVSSQCETRWQPTIGIAGVNGYVHDSVLWDPDGSGPQSAVWILAGNFTAAGTMLANHIASFDPATGQWGQLGAGLDREATALIVMPNNDLIVGGRFTTAGSTATARVARWNPNGWSALGTGLAGHADITALTLDTNGELVAAGLTANAGGWSGDIARWNGVTWNYPGIACNGPIHAIHPLGNGELIVGGSFTTSGTVPTGGIARWNGTSWLPYGSGVGPVLGVPGSVRSLSLAANGDLVIGGAFFGAGSAPAVNLARWDGSAWSTLAGAGTQFVSLVETLPGGDLVVGTAALDGGGPFIHGLARFDGTTWSAIGSGTIGSATSLAIVANGDWLVSGLRAAGGITVAELARWNGTAWQPLEPGLGGPIDAMTTMLNGDLIVTGNFLTSGTATTNRIARWNGNSWSALGLGLDNRAHAVTTLVSGDLVVGGAFAHAGGQPIAALARWDGSNWSPLGSGLATTPFPPLVLALTELSNGDLIVGGAFASAGGVSGPSIARWDGSAWHAMGNEATPSGVYALAASASDELFAAGVFLINGQAHNGVAQWDGTNWAPVGGEFGFPPEAMAIADNGDVWAAGRFTNINGIPIQGTARWNGSSWAAIGSGFALNHGEAIEAITFLPGGDTLVIGKFRFAGSNQVEHVARWNGVDWTVVDGGLDAPATALTHRLNSDLVVGGSFDLAGSVVSSRITTLSTNCPATTTNEAGGCTGSAGPNTLAALSLPWTGSTLRARADGLTSNALALGVFGLSTTNVPLSLLTPLSRPGCTSTVTPDITSFYVPVGGSLTIEVAIPDVPALAGIVGYQQIVAAELDSQGVLTAVTSTNRLAATIGVF